MPPAASCMGLCEIKIYKSVALDYKYFPCSLFQSALSYYRLPMSVYQLPIGLNRVCNFKFAQVQLQLFKIGERERYIMV